MDDLLDLVVELVEALDDAYTELEQLRECEIPLSDKLLKQLEERDALAETLKAVPKDVREFLVPIYREQMTKANRYDSASDGAPVGQEVLNRIEAAFEMLRTRRLLHTDLHDALRGHVIGIGAENHA